MGWPQEVLDNLIFPEFWTDGTVLDDMWVDSLPQAILYRHAWLNIRFSVGRPSVKDIDEWTRGR